VAILDADKEGYLRSGTSLIQTAGRAARHVGGVVIMYADRVTASMAAAIRETDRRRERQAAYNTEHGITPESVQRSIHEVLQSIYERDYYTVPVQETPETVLSADELAKRIEELENQMKDAARRLDFEQAADLRDRVRALRRRHV
jgi:excinuclease ABC subunit B